MSGALRALGAVGGITALVSKVLDFLTGRSQREAGRAEERSAVQKKTIEELEAARKEKDEVNEKVRRTPYDDRVDRL